MAENLYMLLISLSFLAAAGVLVQFIRGWAANQPEVLTGVRPVVTEEPDPGLFQELLSLFSALLSVLLAFTAFIAFLVPIFWDLALGLLTLAGIKERGSKEERSPKPKKTTKPEPAPRRMVKVISLNQRRLQTIAGGLRDRLLTRPEGAPADLVVMDYFPCAFDDGEKVYYNRREMLRIADRLDVGGAYWLMLAGLALIADWLLPGVRGWLGEVLPAFAAHPWLLWPGPQVVMYVFLLAVAWFILRGARSLVLAARVEKVVRPLMIARNQSWPGQTQGTAPLVGPEISAGEMSAMASLAAYGVFIIVLAFLLNLF